MVKQLANLKARTTVLIHEVQICDDIQVGMAGWAMNAT